MEPQRCRRPLLGQGYLPTTIWVVRHAEREDNVNKTWRQSSYVRRGLAKDNSPLSMRGRLQAEELASRLANIHFDYVFTSPYDRCVETAVRIVRERRLPINVEPGLSEVLCLCEKPAGFRALSLLKEIYPLINVNYVPVYARSDLDYAFERLHCDWVCVPRTRATMQSIVDDYRGSLLVVTHGAVVGAIHEIVTGKWSSVGQATVSKFTRFRSEQGFVCEYSGDSSHLSSLVNLRAF